MKRRLVAFALILCTVVSFALVFVLLILGPHVSIWVGDAVGNETVVKWVWWTAQWPILLVGLLTMFAIVLYLAPNVVPAKWQFITPGAVFAVVVWLAASGLFALYTSNFASYNKAWGSLAAVIIMLTWLWFSALALLVGGEMNTELHSAAAAFGPSRPLTADRPACDVRWLTGDPPTVLKRCYQLEKGKGVGKTILITGMARSGGSWVSRMVAGGGDVVHINEPFNRRHPPGLTPGILRVPPPRAYQYVGPHNEAEYVAGFRTCCASGTTSSPSCAPTVASTTSRRWRSTRRRSRTGASAACAR